MEYEGDSDANHSWRTWGNHEEPGKETGRTRNQSNQTTALLRSRIYRRVQQN